MQETHDPLSELRELPRYASEKEAAQKAMERFRAVLNFCAAHADYAGSQSKEAKDKLPYAARRVSLRNDVDLLHLDRRFLDLIKNVASGLVDEVLSDEFVNYVNKARTIFESVDKACGLIVDGDPAQKSNAVERMAKFNPELLGIPLWKREELKAEARLFSGLP
jgi:hypothetical protein